MSVHSDDDENVVESGASGQFMVGDSMGDTSRTSNLGHPGSPTTEGEVEGPFTDEEIRTQLHALGYHNIPDYQLRLFKEDLEKLIWFEQDKRRKQSKDASTSKHTENGGKKKPLTFKDSAQRSGHPDSPMEGAFRRMQEYDEFGWPKGRSPSPPSSDSTRSNRNPRWHRRKVLRHFRGEPVICEEPTDTDTDLTMLSDRVSSLPLDDSESEPIPPHRRPAAWGHDCPIINACVCKKGAAQRHVATNTGSVRKRVDRGLYYDEIVRYLPKSFVDSEPYRPLKKTNPQQRFDMYRRMWNNCRIPGETPDQELRWCIRALLLTRKVPEVEIYALKRKDALEKAKSRRQSR